MASGPFYHYTTRESLDLIKSSKKLLPSLDSTRDALIGKGVYFTKKKDGE